MDRTSLGNLKLPSSVMGLGSGGHSRLGQSYGAAAEESEAIVGRALELGVNHIDTATGYGTEGIVGAAVRGSGVSRSDLLIASKVSCHKDMVPVPWADYERAVHASLEATGLDYLDIYYVHGLYAEHVGHALETILPGLQGLKEQGLIRAAAISEHFNTDPSHQVLLDVVRTAPELVDVLMVGFNILNQSARRELLPLCLEHGIGVTCMFAVRNAFSNPAVLARIVRDLIAAGEVDTAEVDVDRPLDFVLRQGDAATLTEAAYRFCRWEPGINVVLSGTGRMEHLEANAACLRRPALPSATAERLRRIFRRVDSVSGQDRPYRKA